jgi:alpha-tubulin suppressor-like RCC1 family protein
MVTLDMVRRCFIPALKVCALMALLATVLVSSGQDSAFANPLSDVTSLAVGGAHTCAIGAETALTCWGENEDGQLGDGTTVDRAVAGDVLGLTTGIVAVVTGMNHTCALTPAGGLTCWGWNRYGQLGNGMLTGLAPNPTPVDVLEAGVTAVAAGGVHTCSIDTSGGVQCWGRNRFGQVGNGLLCVLCPTPTDVLGLTAPIASVAAGGRHNCALTEADELSCWGDNTFGQLGVETADVCIGALLEETPCSTTPVAVPGFAGGVDSVSTGFSHTCILSDAGGALCWGANDSGQLGDGTTSSRTSPAEVSGLTSGVAAVAAGGRHTCALMVAGGVQCWGENRAGQLGDGTTTNRAAPVDVLGLNGVVAIAAGFEHTCALTATGEVSCWGSNVSGQLGDGSTTSRTSPVAALAELKAALGDVNCDGIVSATDATLILQLVAGLVSSLPCQDSADADLSGDVSAIDATLILQLTAGLIDRLPAA